MKLFNSLYLDNGATTRVNEKVAEAMLPFFTQQYGNPSSTHTKGEVAKEALEEARKTVARSLGADPEEIVFTSGGSESNNLALKGSAFAKGNKEKNHIITSTIEHKSILNTARWLNGYKFKVTMVAPDNKGFIDPETIRKSITSKTLIVSIIHGNNEIGTLQDIKCIGNICKEKGVLFHIDACQSFLKTGIDVRELPVDLISINAHKIHGPKGVGALYVRKGVELTPLIHGGLQEHGLRAGTENVPLIVGFAKAIKLQDSAKERRKLRKLRDMLTERLLTIKGSHLNGADGNNRLVHNINIRFDGIDASALGGYLDRKFIYASTGSACNSQAEGPSYVLEEIGLSEKQARASIRFGISSDLTFKDIDRIASAVEKSVKKLRSKGIVGRLFKDDDDDENEKE
ncbi:MAG: cysteine desulfurase family protein [Nanoarchaeota archaeon]